MSQSNDEACVSSLLDIVNMRKCFVVNSVDVEDSDKSYRSSKSGFSILITVYGTCCAEVNEIFNMLLGYNKVSVVY